MNNVAMELLFRTLGQILNNQNRIMNRQNRIMNHFGIIDRGDWRTTDDSVKLEDEVFGFSTKYEQ